MPKVGKFEPSTVVTMLLYPAIVVLYSVLACTKLPRHDPRYSALSMTPYVRDHRIWPSATASWPRLCRPGIFQLFFSIGTNRKQMTIQADRRLCARIRYQNMHSVTCMQGGLYTVLRISHAPNTHPRVC
ncbi:uncharacterized protein CC84DRAFT_865644 [Paraphaeosphaeria sporulosa]|uniref:Uncharacterized protein n=1 Tax=Paraphaeosphaeria sporulosa TaxID=1460663 RepID=A0A177C865_9PLEO|nr:uncharacterized protein CC84DRAFT_865644 [Paraphaeosphaeria sporulosa]OAG03745.1 hypothetical protein CC84DRAFT_865644 [Paraphaeosphaeria sporulosa]